MLFGGVGNDVLEGGADDDVCDGVIGVDSAASDCETRENIDTRVLPVSLVSDDGIQLDGELYVPVGDALQNKASMRKTAMIISHGAMGSFSNSVPKILGLQAAPLGFTVLALNRRDWGPTGGGGTVLFEDTTLDVGVGIDLLDAMGFKSIYVAGHSQGTQNAGIYPSLTLDERVAAVGMYGAVDDGRTTAKNLLFVFTYEQDVALAESLVAAGLGNDVIGWPTIFGQDLFRSPANYLSFWGPDSLSVLVREITKLEVPALLLRADGDGFTPGKMSNKILAAGQAAGVDIVYEVLDYPFPLGEFGGNAHGFVAVEREMMDATFDWLTDRVPESTRYTPRVKVPQNKDGNFTPLADAGDKLKVPVGGSRVVLDGSNSVDIDGSVVGFHWRQVWGRPVTLDDPTSPTPTFSGGDTPAALFFFLSVTDNAGATDWDLVRVDVTGDQCERPVNGASWSAWVDYWRCMYGGWW